MKLMQLIMPWAVVCCSIACKNDDHSGSPVSNKTENVTLSTNAAPADTFEKGKIISPISCTADGAQTYALYVPATSNNEALPVIYFFDPHGNGSLPLNKYKALADQYGVILVGSNNSKNGNDWRAAENIWNSLLDDTKKRVKINTHRVYVCGFSGGAKVASYVGLNHNEVKAVIANGAGLPEMINSGNLHFSFTAIAGEGDMNMTDLVGINDELDKKSVRHRMILFDGKHEWAPENTMNVAFAGLQFDAMYEKLVPADNEFITNYIAGSKKKITDYSAKKNYIKAEAECKLTINLLDGLTDNVNWFKTKDASLKNDPAYQHQWQAKQNLLVAEQNLKTQYSQKFQQGDMNYWTATIRELQTNAKGETAEGAMYQRLVAYLSLAFYSFSNQLINSNRIEEARYFVELYKLDDPTNSEAWYFSAVLNARSNNAKATEDDLLRAIANGFTDKNRLMQQPEFINPQIDLNMIIGRMN